MTVCALCACLCVGRELGKIEIIFCSSNALGPSAIEIVTMLSCLGATQCILPPLKRHLKNILSEK